MPQTLYGFVRSVSGMHQLGIATLSVIIFLAGTAPLEIQRRIVNAATEGGSYRTILILVSLYFSLALVEGLTKLALNLYRSWVGEVAIRWLRLSVFAASEQSGMLSHPTATEGVQLAIVIAEAEPVGGFVGESISEPLLQGGTLVAVICYLIYLQPLIAILVVVVFFPQIGFVPMMQAAINRRVGRRIVTIRDVSGGIVVAGSALDEIGVQHDRIQALFAINMGIYKLKFSMNFLMNIMIQAGYAGVFALGGYLVIKGRTEIGTVVAFVSGLSKINDPWGAVVDWYQSLKVTQVKYGLIRASAEIGAVSKTADDQSPTGFGQQWLGYR